MIICSNNAEFEDARAAMVGRVAFVPTMGALHAGHLSLVDLARGNADSVVVSIFVNPTQFAPGEDFDSYPRDVEVDLSLLAARGVDCVYLPCTEDIYPHGIAPHLRAADFGDAAVGLEAAFRPHFFDGVASVVHRLFEIVRPDVAVFGEKDYQQLMVIREMVAGLGLPIAVIGAPIARDAHGLALSSRNAYLSDAELVVARRLNVLLKASSLHGSSVQSRDGEMDHTHKACDDGEKTLKAAGFDTVDYVEERWGRALAAAWIGKTRLIDNVEL